LLRLVKLYQIPNFDEMSAVLLAEWIFDNYRFDSFKTVRACLQNPPQTGEKNWRLTPDTIQEWMAIELEKEAAERERLSQLYKSKDANEIYQPPDISEHVNHLIENYLTDIKNAARPVPPLTNEEVRREGQQRPKKMEYHAPGYDYVTDWQKKIRGYQFQTIKDRNPTLTDEEIDRLVDQLPK